MTYTYGVDVSFYQTNYTEKDYRTLVNWKKLYQDGARFAIVRASGNIYSDPALDYHVKAAQDAGLAVGAYHYVYWDYTAEKQADAFLRAINGLGIKRAFIDVEHDNRHETPPRWQPGASITSAYINRWLTYVWGNMPLIPGIYTRKDIWKEFGSKADWVKLSDLWVAWYGYSPVLNMSVNQSWIYTLERTMIPAPFTTWKIWQYSCKGAGYVDKTDPIDFDLFNGNETECREFFGEVPNAGDIVARTYEQKVDALWAAHPELHK